MKIVLRHIIIILGLKLFSFTSIGQQNDTILTDSINVMFWYQYIADGTGKFVEYSESCDTSSIDGIEKYISSCITANVYKTSVQGVFFVREHWFDVDLQKTVRSQGYVKAIKIKRKVLGIPIGTKGCYYQKINNWKVENGFEETRVIKYDSVGPVCTAELPKHYYE